MPLSEASEFPSVEGKPVAVYFGRKLLVPAAVEGTEFGRSPSPIVAGAGGAAPPVLFPKNVWAETLPVHEKELPETIPVKAPLAPVTEPLVVKPPAPALIPVAPVYPSCDPLSVSRGLLLTALVLAL